MRMLIFITQKLGNIVDSLVRHLMNVLNILRPIGLIATAWCICTIPCMQEREKGGYTQEMEEEFEDRAGNVYNKKTYEDLQRQGLI